jgi:hypothetical protein
VIVTERWFGGEIEPLCFATDCTKCKRKAQAYRGRYVDDKSIAWGYRTEIYCKGCAEQVDGFTDSPVFGVEASKTGKRAKVPSQKNVAV